VPGRLIALVAVAFGLVGTAAAGTRVSYYSVSQGTRPHDVAPAPDGTVWFTGQRKGYLGRLDPKTGAIDEIALGETAAPHGVIVGPDGAAWVTDSGLNAIVRYDPKTKVIDRFPLPAEFPNANLNTGTFDRKGIFWFTGQNGVYGRVDPATGNVKAWKSPRGRGPYGITTTPSGDVWYASLAGDHIAKVDVVSGDVAMVDPPRKGMHPRRIWSDSKNQLWVSFWQTGEVGRYDPTTKSWTVWALPDSGSGCYAVYVDEHDKVWLTDFIANAIVRFDPVTETFERFPSDQRSAQVRQLLGRQGEIWGAESGTDRLVMVRN
jgi:virginiamycin B lyase